MVRWTFSLLPQLVQTVYGGGAVRAAARQAELGYGIALCDEEFSRLDVRYAADYAYWNLSAVELYAASMRQYVAIIRSLKEVVDRRFSEGYIAKGDVLMILEAMKMENEIMAPCDGTVTSVSVTKGAAVESGALLCTIG